MEAGGSSGQGQNQQDRRPRLLTYPGFKATFEASSLQDQSRSRSNTIKEAGNESPESGSLYSDEIPSGYNSGEQYDTISCGYMSGEAYELPDTRMELREPNLEVIEECSQPLGGSNSGMDSDNMFSMPVISLGKIFGFRLCIHDSFNQKLQDGAGINNFFTLFQQNAPIIHF